MRRYPPVLFEDTHKIRQGQVRINKKGKAASPSSFALLLEVQSSVYGLDSRDRPFTTLREERTGVLLDERDLLCGICLTGGREVAPILRRHRDPEHHALDRERLREVDWEPELIRAEPDDTFRAWCIPEGGCNDMPEM